MVYHLGKSAECCQYAGIPSAFFDFKIKASEAQSQNDEADEIFFGRVNGAPEEVEEKLFDVNASTGW
jgi:hypothetical protein